MNVVWHRYTEAIGRVLTESTALLFSDYGESPALRHRPAGPFRRPAAVSGDCKPLFAARRLSFWSFRCPRSMDQTSEPRPSYHILQFSRRVCYKPPVILARGYTAQEWAGTNNGSLDLLGLTVAPGCSVSNDFDCHQCLSGVSSAYVSPRLHRRRRQITEHVTLLVIRASHAFS